MQISIEKNMDRYSKIVYTHLLKKKSDFSTREIKAAIFNSLQIAIFCDDQELDQIIEKVKFYKQNKL